MGLWPHIHGQGFELRRTYAEKISDPSNIAALMRAFLLAQICPMNRRALLVQHVDFATANKFQAQFAARLFHQLRVL